MGTLPPSQPFRDAQLYLWQRANHLSCGCLRNYNAASKPVKDWLNAKDDDGNFIHGQTDDAGNQVFWFPKPVLAADDTEYAGVMLKVRPGNAYFDEEEVMDFAKSRGLANRIIKTIEVIDEDELFVLYQEGKITEQEIRNLTHYPEPAYSLWPVKTTETLDE